VLIVCIVKLLSAANAAWIGCPAAIESPDSGCHQGRRGKGQKHHGADASRTCANWRVAAPPTLGRATASATNMADFRTPAA